MIKIKLTFILIN